ncbi:acyltransferase [Litorivita sp. NS0012-18]|uniref:acyltransferase family protein n=1 Tax=Litorivita sp. NS0012-18 TaxID=3127655 RepID=UPI0031085884
MTWIDMARGTAIILVVFGHVWRGLFESEIISDHDLFRHVDQAIYLFHMPVFFILSGFVFRTGKRQTAGAFIKGRALRLLYPLVIWYYAFVGVKILMSSHVNTAFSLDRLLSFPVPFGTHLWFLYALLLIQIICMPLAFTQTRRQILTFSLLIITTALLVKYGVGFFNIWLNQSISYLPYFLVGVVMKELSSRDRLRAITPNALILLGGGAFCLAELLRFIDAPIAAPFLILGLPAAIGFILLVAGVCARYSQSLATGVLTRLGRSSMAIYLAHIFFTAFSRTALVETGVENLWFHLLIGTSVGVLGPMLLEFASIKMRLNRVLGF